MTKFDYMGDDEKSTYCILDDGSVEFGPLSICKLNRPVGTYYQVDVSYYSIQYSKVFRDYSNAFNQFIFLKKTLEQTGYKQYIQKTYKDKKRDYE